MKMKYGKIVCGALRVPQNYPDYIEDASGKKIVNPSEGELLAAGYLPIEDCPPLIPEGKIAVPSYRVSDDGSKILTEYIVEDAPCNDTEMENGRSFCREEGDNE